MKKIDLSTYNKGDYSPGKSKTVLLLWYVFNVIFFMNPLFTFVKIKIAILRIFGAKLGKNINVKPSVNIKYPWHLSIGNNVWMGENVWIDNLCKVTIGDNVCISQGALILTGNHDYSRTEFNLIVKEIEISEGAWIGARSIVAPGASLASHSVLTAGSILSSSTEPYSIYKGNPAVKIKNREIK